MICIDQIDASVHNYNAYSVVRDNIKLLMKIILNHALFFKSSKCL